MNERDGLFLNHDLGAIAEHGGECPRISALDQRGRGGEDADSAGLAHCGQKRAPAGSAALHPAHRNSMGAAQCMQKRAFSGDSRWQAGHSISPF